MRAIRFNALGGFRLRCALLAAVALGLPAGARAQPLPPQLVAPSVSSADTAATPLADAFRAPPPPATIDGGATVAPVRPPRGLGGLSLSARFVGGGAVTAGLDWRVYPDRPDQSGSFQMIKEDRGAAPTMVLPPGGYVVHVSLGLASAAKRIQVGTDVHREVFELAAGGVRFEGMVGDSRIQTKQISFDVYRGSQFDIGEKRPVVGEVATGDVVVLPEGAYYVVSNYGDGNAVMRYDFRIQAGKLSEVRINHRAAMITLKLVGEKGGEALANTAWSVLTPGGDVIKESIGAFPTVVLSEGDYVAIARNEGHVYNRDFKVETGFDREIELVAH
jgi:hypothetical protein